jgi:hypothetical protein
MSAYRDRRFLPENRFFELQVDIFAQIRAALSTASAPLPPEKITNAEEVPEDFAHVLERRWVESTCAHSIHTGVAKAVVSSAFVRIRKHPVSLAAFLEFFFRIRIIGIAVGMELQRQLAIGALELRFRDRAGHTQHFVEIALCVRRQKKPFKNNVWGKLGPDE